MKKSLAVPMSVAALAGVAVTAHRLTARGPDIEPPGTILDLDGERIHVVQAGTAGAPAILLIHGFCGSTFSWRDVVPLLARHYHVVALDLPGFGFSDRRRELEYSLESHGRRAARLLEHLGIARATVVGHSMGGGVAEHLAVRYPERVDRLVLAAAIDAGAEQPWQSVSPLLWASLLQGTRVAFRVPPLVRWAARKSLLRMTGEDRFGEATTLDGYVGPLLIGGTAACFARLAADWKAEPAIDPGRISAPVLVVSGEFDRDVPPGVGAAIAEKIPHARHLVLPGVGHLLFEQEPELFVEEVLTFLHEPAGRW